MVFSRCALFVVFWLVLPPMPTLADRRDPAVDLRKECVVRCYSDTSADADQNDIFCIPACSTDFQQLGQMGVFDNPKIIAALSLRSLLRKHCGEQAQECGRRQLDCCLAANAEYLATPGDY